MDQPKTCLYSLNPVRNEIVQEPEEYEYQCLYLVSARKLMCLIRNRQIQGLEILKIRSLLR